VTLNKPTVDVKCISGRT